MMVRRGGPAAERRLLAAFRALGEREQEMLLAFAEFLRERGVPAPDEPPPVPEPIPRPPEETVVAALKRLARTYPMLDKAEMLNEASALVAQHVLHGRPAAEVIDELERLFRTRYERAFGR